MNPNNLKADLQAGGIAFCGFMQIGHPAVAEVLARAGFGTVFLDAEHGGIDLETGTDIMRAMGAVWGAACTPMVRLPINDSMWIARFLDAGAMGLVVPMVNTVAQARAAVDATRYPPIGRRGFGYNRINNWGVDFDEYVQQANDELTLIVQIEHIDGVNNIDQILDVEGIDGVFVGPYDLSGSMGIVGQMDHPKMHDALGRITDSCRAHDVPAGLHVVQVEPDRVRRAIDSGFRIIALSMDNVLLQTASRQFIAQAQAIVAEHAGGDGS